MANAKNVTEDLRDELRSKGLKGFKKGGKVKTKKGLVHKGEFVVKKAAAQKVGTKALNKINRAPSKPTRPKPRARR